MSEPAFARRVTPEQAEAAAHRVIAAAFRRNDTEHPHFTIPTRESDDDVVLIDYIVQSQAEIRTLRAAAQLLDWYCDWIRYRTEHGACHESEIELANLRDALKSGNPIERPDYWVASPEEARAALQQGGEG